ncbi:MAG TPA: cytochrome c [Anaeromyxobacteraceae bacterium]|nr:cytochrome c [Anaeromyxobacteraceae bacterium]
MFSTWRHHRSILKHRTIYVRGDGEEGDRSGRYESTLTKLRTVLKPLFDHYGIRFGDGWDESRAFRAMLSELRFTISNGQLVVANRATGGVIYSAPLTDLASGVLHPENIPGGTAQPPPPSAPTCTAFTYSAWGACQSSNTQTRTVLSSSPTGCVGGNPVLSQACTFVPPAPAPDGAALYAASCAGCHGALASSNLEGKGISLSLIKSMGMTQGLTDAQLQAIVTAVGP